MSGNFLSKYDPRLGKLKATSVDSIPQVILLKRKSIRLFPEGGIVGLYYAESIDKYISIPFADTGIGISEETVQEETEMSDDVIKSKFSNRVQQLRESKRMEVVSVPLRAIDNAKFDKAIKNTMQAEIAYKKGDFAKGDHHARKAESQSKMAVTEETIQDKIRKHPAVESYDANPGEHFVNLKKGYHWSEQRSFGTETAREAYRLLKSVKKLEEEVINELHPETLATYAAFASRDASKAALKDGDIKRWRKRDKGVKLALSKYRGETKKDRDSKPKGPEMEPRIEKPRTKKSAENSNWQPKAFQWNEAKEEKLDEIAPAVVAGAVMWAGKKLLGGATKTAAAYGNKLAGKDQQSEKDKKEADAKEKAKNADNPNTTTNNPLDKPADPRDKKIKELENKNNNVNEIFEYSFKDGVVQVTGAVLNDMAEVYSRSSAETKTKIIQSISESAELFKKFADFAVKAKGKIT